MTDTTEIKILNQLEHAERSIRIPGESDEDIILGGECLVDVDGQKTITIEIQGDRPIRNRIRVKYPLGMQIVLQKVTDDPICEIDSRPPDENNIEGFIFIPRCFPTKWELIISIDEKGIFRPKTPPNVTIEDDQ